MKKKRRIENRIIAVILCMAILFSQVNDGSGYPDGLKGNAIPMCAQVVGIVDAYDALINDRPYKRKYEPEEAIRMISNGECGAFSKKLIQCLTAAAKQPEWLKVTKIQARQKI